MTVDERLARLERRLSMCTLLIALLGGVLLIMIGSAAVRSPQVGHAEVRTKKLVIVNDKGQDAGWFGTSGDTTALQIGDYRDGIRLEHGPGASGIQLITLADDPIQGKDGIQTNAMSLYVNHFKTGMLMVNPAQADSFESHSRVWLDTENGYGISRKF